MMQEEERRIAEHRREKKLNRKMKRRVDAAATCGQMDDAFAAVMGFKGFGGGSKE